jgi:hypothetical protein
LAVAVRLAYTPARGGIPPPCDPERTLPMHDPKQAQRRRFFTAAASMIAVPLYAISTRAADKKTYKYRCTKCKLVQEYTVPGVKKCPNDGTTMIRMSS